MKRAKSKGSTKKNVPLARVSLRTANGAGSLGQLIATAHYPGLIRSHTRSHANGVKRP